MGRQALLHRIHSFHALMETAVWKSINPAGTYTVLMTLCCLHVAAPGPCVGQLESSIAVTWRKKQGESHAPHTQKYRVLFVALAASYVRKMWKSSRLCCGLRSNVTSQFYTFHPLPEHSDGLFREQEAIQKIILHIILNMHFKYPSHILVVLFFC